jgi:hypothetical protein
MTAPALVLSAYYADFNVAIASTIPSGKWPSNAGSMGSEHDELVKRSGRWYFKRRVVLQ